jgi:hypothetical protein
VQYTLFGAMVGLCARLRRPQLGGGAMPHLLERLLINRETWYILVPIDSLSPLVRRAAGREKRLGIEASPS